MISVHRISDYNPTIFQNIPHFIKQVPKVEILNIQTLMRELGPIFVKHGFFKKFGLIVVHRHFDLSADEILVDYDNDEKSNSLAMPWKVEGGMSLGPVDLEYFQSQGLKMMDKIEDGVIIPLTWSFRSDGSLFPFEFKIKDDDEEGDQPKPEFVAEVFKVLEDVGLAHLFGIRRYSTNFWETTDHGRRGNVAHYNQPIPPHLVDAMKVVFWTLNADWEYAVDVICAGCSSRCSHGGGSSCDCK